MAHAMYVAGFRQVLVGFESGHPRILQNIQKKATREDNTRAVQILHDAGIQVKAAMSIGHPGESEETIEASRQWLLETRPDEFDCTIITVYPGTPYFDDAVETSPGVWTYTDPKSQDRLHAYHVDHLSDVNFYKGIPGTYQSFVYTDHLSAGRLCELRDSLEAEVRAELKIPYPTSAAALQFDRSMGQ
jgi:anaerobic magnesium-protoporphyrin IX monomethyl ester cyclase